MTSSVMGGYAGHDMGWSSGMWFVCSLAALCLGRRTGKLVAKKVAAHEGRKRGKIGRVFFRRSLATLALLFWTNARAEADAAEARITGAFIQITEESGKAGQSYWDAQMKGMQQLGMDTAIVQYVAYDERFYYPTEIRGMSASGSDVVMQVLNAAREWKIKVFLGLQLDGDFWQGKFEARERSELNVATINELHQRYGAHAGLGGWYLPEEIDDGTAARPYAGELLEYLGRLSGRAKELSGLPVMISPFFSEDVDILAYARWWDQKALPAIGVDIVAMQDGVGTHRISIGDLAPVFAGLAPVMQRHNVLFWSNVEAFDQTSGWPVNEAPFAARASTWKRLRRQLGISGPLTGKTILFEYTQYMDPGASPRAKALFEGYRQSIE